MFSIRPVEPRDVDAVLGLVHALAEYEREPDAVEMTSEMLHAALFDDGAKLFGHVAVDRAPDAGATDAGATDAGATDAEPTGEVVAMALWFCNFSTWRGRHGLYLEDLVVHPDHRRRGIGERLLVELARICVERGYARFEWSVLDWNEPAIEFYRSLGAVAMDDWTVYRVTDDALKVLAAR